jgi:hypothetical protein
MGDCHMFIETEYGVRCKSSFGDALSFPEIVPSPVLSRFWYPKFEE